MIVMPYKPEAYAGRGTYFTLIYIRRKRNLFDIAPTHALATMNLNEDKISVQKQRESGQVVYRV